MRFALNSISDRRSLVRAGAVAAGALLVPGSLGGGSLIPRAAARPADPKLPERRIAFRNVHTGDIVDARYFNSRGWDFDGLREIDQGLRDWRTGEVHMIDRRLIGLLTDLRDTLAVPAKRPFDLISGYRSAKTNSALREAGGDHTGVATKSQHMLGKATDIALPGVSLATVRAAARALGGGGVGFYPRDGFVHVDTGRVRFW